MNQANEVKILASEIENERLSEGSELGPAERCRTRVPLGVKSQTTHAAQRDQSDLQSWWRGVPEVRQRIQTFNIS